MQEDFIATEKMWSNTGRIEFIVFLHRWLMPLSHIENSSKHFQTNNLIFEIP
jgi:hypothetical protein